MEIRHADLQIEVEDAEDGGVLLTIIDSARLSFGPRRDWRGSVARRMPGGRFSSLLQDVHRRRQSYRLRWKRRRRRC